MTEAGAALAAGAASASAAGAGAALAAAAGPSGGDPTKVPSLLIARCLRSLGATTVFGVVGVPVTDVGYAVFREPGMRFVSCRTEHGAGYAAAATAYLMFSAETRTPGVLLTTGGPGFLNALTTLGHAAANRLPLVALGGSCALSQRGRGAFQELDQVAIARPVLGADACLAVAHPAEIPRALRQAFEIAAERLTAVYVDIPADVLMSGDFATVEALEAAAAAAPAAAAAGGGAAPPTVPPPSLPLPPSPAPPPAPLRSILSSLRAAQSPLIVFGKGASMSSSAGWASMQQFVEREQIPFLTSPMGRGVLSDEHPLCVSAARSAALAGADAVLLAGCRLNWMFHLGDPCRWKKKPAFMQIDLVERERDGRDGGSLVREFVKMEVGEAFAAMLAEAPPAPASAQPPGPQATGSWASSLSALARKNRAADRAADAAALDAAPSPHGMTYKTAFAVIREALDRVAGNGFDISVVSEGAKVMDVSRVSLPVYKPRGRLDAGTWGTMGVGVPYVLATALANAGGAAARTPPGLTVAVEGDSAIGFSIGEIDTLVRFGARAIIVVFNNGGIYSGVVPKGAAGEGATGDAGAAGAAGSAVGGHGSDPAPTVLSQETRYDMVASGFGAISFEAATAVALRDVMAQAVTRCMSPLGPAVAVINARIIPWDLDVGGAPAILKRAFD